MAGKAGQPPVKTLTPSADTRWHSLTGTTQPIEIKEKALRYQLEFLGGTAFTIASIFFTIWAVKVDGYFDPEGLMLFLFGGFWIYNGHKHMHNQPTILKLKNEGISLIEDGKESLFIHWGDIWQADLYDDPRYYDLFWPGQRKMILQLRHAMEVPKAFGGTTSQITKDEEAVTPIREATIYSRKIDYSLDKLLFDIRNKLPTPKK